MQVGTIYAVGLQTAGTYGTAFTATTLHVHTHTHTIRRKIDRIYPTYESWELSQSELASVKPAILLFTSFASSVWF